MPLVVVRLDTAAASPGRSWRRIARPAARPQPGDARRRVARPTLVVGRPTGRIAGGDSGASSHIPDREGRRHSGSAPVASWRAAGDARPALSGRPSALPRSWPGHARASESAADLVSVAGAGAVRRLPASAGASRRIPAIERRPREQLPARRRLGRQRVRGPRPPPAGRQGGTLPTSGAAWFSWPIPSTRPARRGLGAARHARRRPRPAAGRTRRTRRRPRGRAGP